MNKFIFIILCCFLSFTSIGQHPDLVFTQIQSGFSSPVGIVNAGDGSNRLFIVQRGGIIKIMEKTGDTWSTLVTPFLDLSGIVTTSDTGGDERGLLGLTFHPNFSSNGFFYVNYTFSSGGLKTRVERYKVSANPNVADVSMKLTIIEIDQEQGGNHNGGDLKFGPDGMLYIGMGDGGSGNDPDELAQNPQNLLGKMLRIDVDSGSPYVIPEDNPFTAIGDGIRDEIWAFGLRNPWRFSFDRLTGDMWIGDVGQNAKEEVNFQPANSTGGENYGWDCYEADIERMNEPNCFSNGNPLITHAAPIFKYDQASSTGFSISGGCVYRGSEYPALYGYYIVGDYATGTSWTIKSDGDGGWTEDVNSAGTTGLGSVVAFGEDEDGELYAAEIFSGRIKQVSTNAVVLATDFLQFKGQYDKNKVSLNWEVSSTENIQSFEIEKSEDGKTFKNIGTVNINNDDKKQFEFNDYQPFIPSNYYRLKQVYRDNSYDYSKIILVHTEGLKVMSIFPNPSSEVFNLNIQGQSDKPMPLRVRVLDLAGKVVLEKDLISVNLPFNQQIILREVPNGIYTVEATFGKEVLIQKLAVE